MIDYDNDSFPIRIFYVFLLFPFPQVIQLLANEFKSNEPNLEN